MTPRAPTNLPPSPRAAAHACGLALLLCLLVSAGRADDLKLNEIWLPNVQIVSLRDGKLTYQTSTGAVIEKFLVEVEGVRFADLPQYQEAVAKLEAGDARGALPLLDRAAREARTPWARAYVGAARWRALAQAGDARAAVRAYLDLANTGVDPHFLADPPVQTVRDATDPHRDEIAASLRAALSRASDPVKPHLQAMLDAAATAPAAPAQAPVTPAEPAPSVASTSDGAVVLPVKIGDSAATRLLRQGRFDEALAQIASDVEQPGGLAVDLYLQGVAYLHKAEQTGEAAAYRDAGLAFMRVVVYFPRSDFAGRNLVGGSLLELAFIHDKLGRTDKATELYARAAARLDAASDPNLHQRLTQLREARP